MELHILLAGVEFGPYTDDQARDLLGEGFLSESDPAKRLDETDWLPLSEVLAKSPAPAAAMPAAPVEEISSGEEEPAPHTTLAAVEEAPETETPPAFEWPAPEPEEMAAPEAPVAEETEASAAASTEEPAPEPTSGPKTEREAPPRVTVGRRMVATRPLSPAEKTAFLLPATAQLPSVAPTRARTIIVAPATEGEPTPILSTTPLLQVSLPAKAKKAMRTGSLLAKEALNAARTQKGVLSPEGTTPSDAPAPTQPAPAEKETSALPRRKSPVVLRGREESGTSAAPGRTLAPPSTSTAPTSGATELLPPTNPATTQRKAIRLTGRITLPGVAPKPELPQGQSPSLSGPLHITRPSRTGGASPRSTTRALSPQERATFLTGEIARPADVARQETSAETATSAPASVSEEKTVAEVPADLHGEESDAAATPSLAVADEPVAEEPGPTKSDTGAIAALLQAAGTETVAEPSTESGALPAVEEPPHDPDLSASGRLLSSGELAERRSLKITGALRHPAPRTPIRLSSPSKPGDSSRLPFPGAERRPSSTALPLSETPATLPAPLPPAPEESLPPRPETGKIPVSAMPTEGIRIRTRRTTGKVPVPEKERAPEPLSARATPPPALPEAPAEPAVPAAPARILSLTPPPAEPVSLVALPAESAAPVIDRPAVLSEDDRKLPGPTMTASAPPADVAAVELPSASAASSVEVPEAPGVATPDKARLRRPVKLELTSRAKNQETGRLSLEAFSKMASLELPGHAAPSSAIPVVEKAGPVAKKAGSSQVEPISPPGPTTTSATTDFDKPRLEEAPPLVWKSKLPKVGWRPEWVAYAIITVGVVALCAVVYILVHRSHATVAAAPVVTTAPETPSNEKIVPPPSAAPPQTAPTPAPANPTVSAPTPAPAKSSPPPAPANAAPPTAIVQDLNRQVDAFLGDGTLKYQRGDLAGALADDNQALDLNPKSAQALFNRGLVKAQQTDLDGAEADYSSALQIDPNLGTAYYYRGLARHAKGDLNGAISDYGEAIRIDPKNAFAFFNRGLIRMQKDDIDGAIVDSTRALELDPHMIQSYYDRGLGRLAQGSMDSALADMKTFCQLAPQDAYTDYARLYIWLIESQQGHLAEANQELSKAMNSGWNGAVDSMVTRIGEFLLGQIGENELIKTSASAIPTKDQGHRCEAWYFIGMRQLQAGDRQAAMEDLRKCVGTQKTDYCEYILAQEAIKALSPAGEATAAPAAPRAQAVTLPDPGTMTTNEAPADAAPVEK